MHKRVFVCAFRAELATHTKTLKERAANAYPFIAAAVLILHVGKIQIKDQLR